MKIRTADLEGAALAAAKAEIEKLRAECERLKAEAIIHRTGISDLILDKAALERENDLLKHDIARHIDIASFNAEDSLLNTLCDMAIASLTARRGGLLEAAKSVAAIPTRSEPLGGQTTKYIQRDEAIDTIRALAAQAPAPSGGERLADELEPYFLSGNSVPVTRAVIPVTLAQKIIAALRGAGGA